MFHFDAVVQEMIINGIWETLYMTLASTFMGYAVSYTHLTLPTNSLV